jgi:hypothetical protein
MASTSHKALNAALKTRAFAPVYFFHGDDDYQKEDAVRLLVDAAVDRHARLQPRDAPGGGSRRRGARSAPRTRRCSPSDAWWCCATPGG